MMKRHIRTLSDEEVSAGAHLIRMRSHRPLEDLALYYIQFATGARPLEIARLEIRDYLDSAGSVRRASVVREEVAITSRARPLYFQSTRLDDALDAYLADRVREKANMGFEKSYRGLDPRSKLFLSASGSGFQITPCGGSGQRRYSCRGIQESYRKLFHYAGLDGITALKVRYTVAERLYSRGADESQVGLLLGVAERGAIREKFPRCQRTLDELVRDLV